MSKEQGFYITGKKGFHITFPNGYTVSVQFGPGNYCGNYDMRILDDAEIAGSKGSRTAETAIIHPHDGLIPDPNDGEGEHADTVQGYQTVDQVMDRIMRVSSWPKPEDQPNAAQERKEKK